MLCIWNICVEFGDYVIVFVFVWFKDVVWIEVVFGFGNVDDLLKLCVGGVDYWCIGVVFLCVEGYWMGSVNVFCCDYEE